MPVMESPGTAHYTVIIYGMSPEHIVPSSIPDYLTVDIEVAEAAEGAPGASAAATVSAASSPAVPEWIKTAAGFWVSGSVSDTEFASAIEFLILRGVLQVPPAEAGGGSAAAVEGVSIPEWVKTSTDFWVARVHDRLRVHRSHTVPHARGHCVGGLTGPLPPHGGGALPQDAGQCAIGGSHLSLPRRPRPLLPQDAGQCAIGGPPRP